MKAEDKASAWTLPVDAESGAGARPPALLTKLEPGSNLVQLTPDGSSALLVAPFKPNLPLDCRTRHASTAAAVGSSQLRRSFCASNEQRAASTTPVILAGLESEDWRSRGEGSRLAACAGISPPAANGC